jgi:hypothetical protein
MSSITRPIAWIRTSQYSRRLSGLSNVGPKKTRAAAYPRRSNLSSWLHPNHVVLGPTETSRIGCLEVTTTWPGIRQSVPDRPSLQCALTVPSRNYTSSSRMLLSRRVSWRARQVGGHTIGRRAADARDRAVPDECAPAHHVRRAGLAPPRQMLTCHHVSDPTSPSSTDR